MFTSLLSGCSTRPAKYAAPGERQPIVSAAPPAANASRPSAVAATVEVAVSQTADGLCLRVKGEARVECAGALLHGLLVRGRRPAVVTLELSELRCISPLAVGVLAAYCRSVVRSGGRVRLTGVLASRVKESAVQGRTVGAV
jgi:anti-anti-sigma regulatory factor